MKKENLLEHIDKYLNGGLSEQERLFFEARISSDSDLHLQVQKQKLANQFLLENRLSRLKFKMNDDFKSGFADKVIYKNFMLRCLWIGLGVIIVSMIAYFIWDFTETQNKSIVSNQEISIGQDDKKPEVPNAEYKEQVNANIYKNNNEISNTKSLKEETRQDNLAKEEVASVKPDEAKADSESPFENNVTDAFHLNKKDDCYKVVLLINGTATETCLEKNEGTLDLSIHGGTPPYQCGLKKNGSEEVVWKASGVTILNELGAGRYEVVVKDKNGCVNYSRDFFIKEKNCKREEVEEYSFRPEYDEKFILLPESEGNIIIYDRSGKEMLKSELQIDNEFRWDGTDRQGRFADKGVYLFVIQYKDGNSKKGYITVY